jgi:hypothetical protein
MFSVLVMYNTFNHNNNLNQLIRKKKLFKYLTIITR